MIRNNNNISKQTNKWLHILLLLSWLAIGISLRFTNLGEKSPSSIEISTLGFSLGHGFLQVPLDRVISLDRLLLPLRFDATTTPSDVMQHLMNESNHPPLYFVLTHLWLKLFLHNGELASLWIGRSLSAILGAASIPAMFGLGWLAFRSLLVAQIAAALMAVSPYGIYLAQEARHYTLTILWIVASLSCLIVAVRCIYNRTALPVWIGSAWIIVNSLGFATHYFFSLSLCAEGLVIGGFWLRDFRVWLQSKSEKINPIVSTKFPNTSEYWRRIYLVAAGSAIGCLVWLPVIQSSSHNELTEWIETSFDLDQIWQPIPRLLGWWITMVFLLPVEGTNLAVTTISGLVVLIVLLWVSPAVMRGILSQMASLSPRLSIQVLGGFVIGAIAIFVMIIYGLGRDLSQAARYHFVYFPSAIVLLAAALAICWRESVASRDVPPERFKRSPLATSVVPIATGKKVVVVILLMGLLGAFTVVSNYGYQKSRRSDLLASQIQATSTAPMLIAMTYETHAELRALTGLAVDFKRLAAQEVEPTVNSEQLPVTNLTSCTKPWRMEFAATQTKSAYADLRQIRGFRTREGGFCTRRSFIGEGTSPTACLLMSGNPLPDRPLLYSRDFNRQVQDPPEFLLVQRKNHSSTIPSALATILTQLPRPLDLWAVNLKVDSNDIAALNCHMDSRKPNINGYRYRLYRCR